jgi:hypothetical protein
MDNLLTLEDFFQQEPEQELQAASHTVSDVENELGA